MNTLVLGGGMAGLAAASRLQTERAVTVVQRGWRLGGKASSHRGVNGRIEEHGLHVWLGYYDNAFRLIQEAYVAIDRPRSDPECPIVDWRDAFSPSNDIGVFDRHDDGWTPWMARFATNDREPGGEGPAIDAAMMLRQCAGLLASVVESLSVDQRTTRQTNTGLVLSASPVPPGQRSAGIGTVDQLRSLLDNAELALDLGMVQLLNSMSRLPNPAAAVPIGALMSENLRGLRRDLRRVIERRTRSRRLWELVDLMTSVMIGIYRDDLLASPAALDRINHLDFREWLVGHGAESQTVESGLIRGMYDLVFAYRGGDHAKPAFEAGTGLLLAAHFFFGYKGALFWKMQAGMGETAIAPIYQSLHSNGVQFRFFHRVIDLELDDCGRRVEAVTLGRQARIIGGDTAYEPLVRHGGIPCFPDGPLADQLAGSSAPLDSESHFGPHESDEIITLRAGRDFDDIVLAVSLGALPIVASQLLEANPRLRACVDHVATVSTQSLQVWTGRDEAGLGWPSPGSTIAGFSSPFDTYSSMPQLIAYEDWGPHGPASVAYFCAALPDADADADADADPTQAGRVVRANAAAFLRDRITTIWPEARTPEGDFDWGVLHEPHHRDERDLDRHYWRANIDPSDRYVQSLPGTGRHRLGADESGFENVHLAGDWVDSGLNAGCIEAAVISGLQAANSALGRDVSHGIIGGWKPIGHQAGGSDEAEAASP